MINRYGQTQVSPIGSLLAQNLQAQPKSPLEVGARLLSTYLLNNKMNQQQEQKNQALMQALSAKEFRNPDNPDEVLQSRPELIAQTLGASGDPQLQQLGLAQALQEPRERFIPVKDANGNIIGQRSSATGRVVADPRAPKVDTTKPAKFVNFANPQTGKIVSAREGSPEAEQYVAAGYIRSGNTGGMKLQVNPDGSISFSQGGPPTQLGKTATGQVEKDIVATSKRLDRLDGIQQAYEPRFLEYGTKFDVLKSRVKEKAGLPLSDAERKDARAFSTFKRRSTEELNLTIRDLSGAAVTEQEAVRLRASMPDVGDDIFSGDSPTEFKAKLDDTINSVKAAQARLIDLRQRGLVGPTGQITEQLAKQYPIEDYKPAEQKTDYTKMPFNDLRTFIESASEADLDALPEETRNMILQRLQAGK